MELCCVRVESMYVEMTNKLVRQMESEYYNRNWCHTTTQKGYRLYNMCRCRILIERK